MFESKFCHSFESKHQKNWFPPEVTEGAKDEVKKPKGPPTPTRSLDLQYDKAAEVLPMVKIGT